MINSFLVKAILFDMDGTLVDSTPVVVRTWSQWAAKHNLDAREVIDYAHGRPTADTVRRFKPELDAVMEAALLLSEEELDTTPVIEIPGALAAVKAVQQHAKWAVVTSASRLLAELRLRLAGFPKPAVLIGADDVQRGKPDPEGFSAAAARLGVSPSECIVFEDTPAGLAAARASGAIAIALSTTYPADVLRADAIVQDFRDVSVASHGGGVLLVRLEKPLRPALNTR